jgi:hypothetical protein
MSAGREMQGTKITLLFHFPPHPSGFQSDGHADWMDSDVLASQVGKTPNSEQATNKTKPDSTQDSQNKRIGATKKEGKGGGERVLTKTWASSSLPPPLPGPRSS